MKLKGTQILFEILKQEKVDTLFGYPGGAVLDIYDELYKTDIRHVLVRHEQGAVHAADGYARASGKVGVCLVTSGPGATNTVTGVATANMDSIPLVVFTGQVATHLIGNDAFQECDITGITRPCTKHNFLVRNIDDLTETIRKAFWIARSGRPGPVLVDLPKNVMASETEFNSEPPKRRKMDVAYEPTPETYDEILEMIRQAKRPVLMIGGGIVLGGASTELTAFARKLQIPVTGTLMGLGAFPGTDPLWLGMVGMHGTYYANMSVTNTDLLIIIGARCDDRVTSKLDCFACGAKIIHVDVDESSIEKNVAVDLALVSDAKRALGHMNKMIEERHYSINPAERSDWLNRIQDWKQQEPLRYEQTDRVIKPQYVIEKLYELTKGEAIITTEVGQNQMWTAQFYHFDRPHAFISSGGLGTMGYGLPAAIGAQCALPEKLVIDIAGDGSIQMNIQEMATAVQHNLPVKVVLLNNGFLGMVRQWQELFYERRYSQTDMTYQPDFVKLAEAYGWVGLRTDSAAEVESMLRQAIATPRPVLIDFHVDREEGVYPMVRPGAGINEMTLCPWRKCD